MRASFKGAVVVSALAHSMVFLPFYNVIMPAGALEDIRPMVVDYLAVKEPAAYQLPDKGGPFKAIPIPQHATAVMSPRPTETAKVEPRKNAQPGPGVSIKPAAADRKGAVRHTAIAGELAKRQAKIESTKYYVDYYQLIREKISERLQANYRPYSKEGDVRLLFTLNSNGSLARVSVDDASSTNDRALRDIAVLSAREAAPFPAFPGALSLPEISFDVVVSFRRG